MFRRLRPPWITSPEDFNMNVDDAIWPLGVRPLSVYILHDCYCYIFLFARIHIFHLVSVYIHIIGLLQIGGFRFDASKENTIMGLSCVFKDQFYCLKLLGLKVREYAICSNLFTTHANLVETTEGCNPAYGNMLYYY